MQFEERWQVVPVGAINEVEHLSFKYRRSVVMACQPCGGIHQKLDAYQPTLIFQGLVDQRFRTGDIDLAVSIESQVHVMNAHGSVIRTSNAAEERFIPSC